jgi:poly-gamma-glutamate capsule biosynthesis protein CapA/YwtB (metallophosphatase superfamily)
MSATINFFGDIAIFKKYEQMRIDPFKEVCLSNADYNIGNFEMVIPNNREKEFFDVQPQYVCSYSYFESLFVGKFQALGLANNHCLDYGLPGVKDTVELLTKKGVKTFGFSENNDNDLFFFRVNDITFCIIAFVKNGRWSKPHFGYGPNHYDSDKIKELIRNNKASCDHIIVYPHWGTELVDVPDPIDVRLAREFIDTGASAVIGHHPHVIQGIERYKTGVIAYSLGSFIYISEEEAGYNKTDYINRNLSLCLNCSFNKDTLISCSPIYYKHNDELLLPKQISSDSNEYVDYINKLNCNLGDINIYKQKLRDSLLKREIRAFW